MCADLKTVSAEAITARARGSTYTGRVGWGGPGEFRRRLGIWEDTRQKIKTNCWYGVLALLGRGGTTIPGCEIFSAQPPPDRDLRRAWRLAKTERLCATKRNGAAA